MRGWLDGTYANSFLRVELNLHTKIRVIFFRWGVGGWPKPTHFDFESVLTSLDIFQFPLDRF